MSKNTAFAITLLFTMLAVPRAHAQGTSPAPAGSAAAPASPSASAPQSTADKNLEYTVGPQDVLKITVFDEPALSGTYRVDADGSFDYPMLGRVQGSGRSLRQIEADITRRLEDGFVRRAQVDIDVDQFRSRSVFIVGEVRSPGKYPMTGSMTLIEALAAAGSTTPAASTEVLILRPRDPNTAQPALNTTDASSVKRVSLTDLQLGRLSENVTLQDGDTIFIPKAEKFFITGQVKSPGAYTYERGLTVLQALSLAGGLTDKGSNRRMKVIRIIKGKKTEQKIDEDDLIQPGDTLVVPQRLL